MRRFCAIWRTTDPALSLVMLAAVSAVVLFARGLPWRGEWMWTLDWAAGATILTGPLTAGLAAFQSARWRAVTTELLLPTARRRLAASFTPLTSVLATSIAAYLLGTAVLLGITSAYHPSDRFGPVLWSVGVAKLATCAAVGWLLGSRLPAYVAAAVAVAACYVVTLVASGSQLLAFWRVGGSTGPPSGQVVDPGYTGGALLLFLGLTGSAAGTSLWRSAKARRVALAAIALAGLAAAAGLVLTSGPDRTYDRADAHPHRLCRGVPVAVCLLAGNTRQLDSWSEEMNRAAHGLAGLGLDFPARYEQPGPGRAKMTAVGLVFFDPGTINIRPPSHLYVAESLATPATCRAYAAEAPPIQALAARAWLTELIARRAWPGDPSFRDPQVTAWLKQTSAADQDRWIQTTFAGLRACALSEIDTPVGR